MIPEILKNMGKRLRLEQEPKRVGFFERTGALITCNRRKDLDLKVNFAIVQLLHQEVLNIEDLKSSTNERLEDFGRKSEDYHYIPVDNRTIRNHLNYLSGYSVVTQEQDGSWSLTKDGKEVADWLMGKPRSKEQQMIDLFESLGSVDLDLEGADLKRFARNWRRFIPIMPAVIDQDTARPFDLSTINTKFGGRVAEEVTNALKQAWENFKAEESNQ